MSINKEGNQYHATCFVCKTMGPEREGILNAFKKAIVMKWIPVEGKPLDNKGKRNPSFKMVCPSCIERIMSLETI